MPPSFASFVHQLTLARQQLALYQEGHPLRRQAAARAHAELVPLVARQGALAIGVAPEELAGPEERLDSEPARKLAAALHARGVALLRFDEGIAPEELATLLELLVPRPDRDRTALWTALAERGVEHIHLEAIDLDELVGPEGSGEAPASLWDRILERLLGSGLIAGEGRAAGERSPEEIRAAIGALIERYQRTAGRSGGELDLPPDLAAGLREVVGEHLAASGGSGTTEVVALLAAVPAPLRPPVLVAAFARLCREGAGGEEREAALTLAAAVDPTEVLAALRRLLGQGIELAPEALEQLDPFLVAGATARSGGVSPAAIAEQLAALYAEDDIDRVQPGAGADERRVLHLPPAASVTAAGFEDQLATLADHRHTVELARSLLELLERSLFDPPQLDAICWRLVAVIRDLTAGGQAAEALELARTLKQRAGGPPSTGQRAARRGLDRLRRRETAAALIDALETTTDRRPIEGLVTLLGPATVGHLVVALGEEEDRGRRRRLFDLLSALGPGVVPHVVALAGDERWYVVRNMFSVLQRVGAATPPQVIADGLGHADPRVRIEAVKALAALAGTAPAELVERAIRDPEGKVAEAAVVAVGIRRIGAGREPLLGLLEGTDPLGHQRELRIKALRALGRLGDPEALPALRRFFRGWLPGISAEERRAAFASLAHYPAAARQPLVAVGLRSPDPEIRATCARLEAVGAGGDVGADSDDDRTKPGEPAP